MNDWYLAAEGFADFQLIALDKDHPENWAHTIAENEYRLNALLRLNMTFAQLIGV